MVKSAAKVRSVQEQVVDNLRRLILEGSYVPGDKLRQEDLATQLGVSAMPVREGLRQLQTEGLVGFFPGRGAFVATLSASELEELYRMREELEVLALRWAMAHLGPADLARLEDMLHQAEEAQARQDVHQRARLMRAFLWGIFEAAGRPHLSEAIHRYYRMTYLYQRQYAPIADLVSLQQTYRRMLSAMTAGDVEGAVAAHRETHRLVREAYVSALQ